MPRNNRGFLTAESLKTGDLDQWATLASKAAAGEPVTVEIGYDHTGMVGNPYFVRTKIGDAVNHAYYERLNDARTRFRALVRRYQ